jgi:hypothetical protein
MNKQEKQLLRGHLQVWRIGEHERLYADVNIPYQHAVKIIIPNRYEALSGRGEQRELQPAWSKKLSRAMLEGSYTPTPITASLRPEHKRCLTIDRDKGKYELQLGERTLAETDGQHRMDAIRRIRQDVSDKVSTTSDKELKKSLETQLKQIDSLPIVVRIFFDGDARQDFLRLQLGRAADRAQMFSMRVSTKESDPMQARAWEIGKVLHNTEDSPFKNTLRFDSVGNLIPISSLCARGGSDSSTSLVGLAKVSDQTPKVLASYVIMAYKAIQQSTPGLLARGHVLTTIGNGGKKGSATMMIGLGICLAYRLAQENKDQPDAADLQHLVETVRSTMADEVEGSFSGSQKRMLMGRFARSYFADQQNLHDGVPLGLLQIIPPSAYDADPLPKRPRGRPKVVQPVEDPQVTTEGLQNQVQAAEGPTAPWDNADGFEITFPEDVPV